MSEFSVNYWASNPDLENDDCMTGVECDTLAEALAIFNDDNAKWAKDCYIEYIEIDGPGVYQLRKNPHFNRRQRDLDRGAWGREFAQQAGMMGGCEAYNDAMGY